MDECDIDMSQGLLIQTLMPTRTKSYTDTHIESFSWLVGYLVGFCIYLYLLDHLIPKSVFLQYFQLMISILCK